MRIVPNVLVVFFLSAVCQMVCVSESTSGATTPEREGVGYTFEDRVADHRAVEEVYWHHRIWPEQNPGPKPSLSEVLPENTLVRRVEDSLRLSNLLQSFWHQPITAGDLQNELDRLVRETHWPEMLGELFEALDHDPKRIAECIARPLLAERLVRERFAADQRIHGELRGLVERKLHGLGALDDMPRLGGSYLEDEWVMVGNGTSKWELMQQPGGGEWLILEPEQWQRLTARLDSIPTGEVSGLIDEKDRFGAVAVLMRSEHRVRVASVVWPKLEFDDWWREVREGYSIEVAPIETQLFLRPVDNKRDPMGNSWLSTSTGDSVPSDRGYHTATWTGSEMCVWGGRDSMSTLSSGSLYYPAVNAWSTMSSTNKPESRYHHTAVWTGTYVVIWGGWKGGAGAHLDNGGLYNPTGYSWSSLPFSGEPSARREHTATWTGTRMVIFGGYNGTDYVREGGRWGYNFWTSMSATNAPSKRSGHTAVYCSQPAGPVVVWGGANASGIKSDGGEYNVNTNAWTTIPANGSVAGRTNHSAVYTSSVYANDYYDGQRVMIVWGGNTGVTTVNNGAEYNPVNNQWTAISGIGSPSQREGHTAVWTGWTMIVWGGFNGSSLRNTGGIYNPVNKVWESTSTTGAPAAREAHTAIWRGDPGTLELDGKMTVWGGDTSTGYTNTGGRYTPVSDFLLAAHPEQFETVPGAIDPAAFTVDLYSLSGFSGDVTLECDNYWASCSFDDNPVSLSANAYETIDVTVRPNSGLNLTDYPLAIYGEDGAGNERQYYLSMRVQDFEVSCAQSTLAVPPGGSAQITCTVSSLNNFNDPVVLDCDEFYCSCAFSPGTVTPLPGGTKQTTLTVTAGTTPGTYRQEVRGRSHGAYREFDLDVEVGALLFADGFESGDLTAWANY